MIVIKKRKKNKEEKTYLACLAFLLLLGLRVGNLPGISRVKDAAEAHS